VCRNIRTLHNFEPPATRDEVRAAAVQYVRKVAGMRKPAAHNQAAFDAAVEAVETATWSLVSGLERRGKPRDREVEAEKGRARWARRNARLKEGAEPDGA
jgi:hypothetical protein